MGAGAQERSLEDIKRNYAPGGHQDAPFDHVRADEVDGVLKSLTSLDKEEWGTKWCKVGLAHEAKATPWPSKAHRQGTGQAYDPAFGYCLIGRYPVPSSPAKKEAYGHAAMFQKAAGIRRAARGLEVPFEGKKSSPICRCPRASPGRRSSCTGAAWTSGKKTSSATRR